MPHLNRSALVPYTPEQMYDLVNDVLAYPQFIPGCVGSRIISSDENHMEASLDIAKYGIRKTFSTKNTLVKNQTIKLSLGSGPFKSLSGQWNFIPIENIGCKIEFTMDFEFINPLVELMFGKIFAELTQNLINAFTLRANEVYSKERQ